VNDDVTTAVYALAVMGGAAALIWLGTVAEAKDGRIRKGTHSGDPLD
jgi:hypothetical protein